jgi:hypothetical protein
MASADVTFEMVMDVTRSWDYLKELAGYNYQERIGQAIYIK